MSDDSQCSVALPQGVVGWSAVCDCGISWSYASAFSVAYTCEFPWDPDQYC